MNIFLNSRDTYMSKLVPSTNCIDVLENNRIIYLSNIKIVDTCFINEEISDDSQHNKLHESF